jgi:hypothetical protein
MFCCMSPKVGIGCTGPGQTSPACGGIGATTATSPSARMPVSLAAGGAFGLPNGQVSRANCRSLAQEVSNSTTQQAKP